MRRDAPPRITLVFRYPSRTGGRAEGEAISRLVDIQTVSIDEIIGVLLR
jgi:hypothetical protein